MLTLIALTLFVGAEAMHHLEGWAYGDAVYWSFITLLTIGIDNLV